MRKILLIRFSSIGDLVLTSPVIRTLSKQMPDTELHFLTKRRFVGILENNPYLVKIYSFEENLQEVIPELKQEKFDLIIDLHKNLRSYIVRWKLGIKSISFNKLNIEKWLMVRLKINCLPQKHIVDRYFDSLKILGIQNDLAGLDYFEGEKNVKIKESLPKAFQKEYVVFALAGTYFTKKIPYEKWQEMAKLSPLPIVLLGGQGENELGDNLLKETLKVPVYSACGDYDLNQSAAVIRHTELVVTGDTGLMHIAAAYQKKIVSLWGNTIPEFGMSPYIPQKKENITILENKNLKCRPCSKLGYNKCPKGHFDCMMQLDVSNVFRQI
ncbi:MAG: glycosyltransferase family 9 protein [Bacteroidales bacterium]|nr:glycosyltransferase family 9 protein [Bacteroidales bacterium]